MNENLVVAFWEKIRYMYPNTAGWNELPPDVQGVAIQGINALLFALQSAQRGPTNDAGTTTDV